MNLKKLIQPFADLNNSFGDIAKDVLADEHFPADIHSINDLPNHLTENEVFMNVFYYFALDQGMMNIIDDQVTWHPPFQ